MGLISYHRAGVAQRQARSAVRASRRIGDALDDVQAQNEQLNELVNQQAEMIERLETELGELRRQIEER
jgi:methyl-accepting chemotaxis protein